MGSQAGLQLQLACMARVSGPAKKEEAERRKAEGGRLTSSEAAGGERR